MRRAADIMRVGGDKMATARTRANRKYNEKAYDRVYVTVPKGRKAEIEAAARANGETLNGLINRLLDEYMRKQ